MAKHKELAKKGARIAGRGLMAIAKHRAPDAGWGAGARVVEGFAAEHVEAIKTKWWGGPAAIFGASCLGLVKGDRGKALAGAAGYAGAFNWELKQFQDGKREHSPVRDFRDTDEKPKKEGAQGNDDASGLQDAGLRNDDAMFN